MVLGHEVTVTYCRKMKGNDRGEFFTDPFRIRILSDENWRNTLNHELIHMMLWVSGISEMLGEKSEEAIVKAIELGFASVLILDKP